MPIARSSFVVDYTKRNTLEKIVTVLPQLTSDGAGWSGVDLHYYHHPAHAMQEHSFKQHNILITLSDGVKTERRLGDRHQTKYSSAGETAIIPAHMPHRSIWDKDSEFIVLTLEPHFLKRISSELEGADGHELVPYCLHDDPLIHGISLSLKAELDSGGSWGQAYVEHLTTAFCSHLLRQYSTRPIHIRSYSEGLSRYKLNKAIDYIQSHLDQTVKLADVAEVLGMSQYYFCRLFHQSMGIAPYRYVIQQRVERAKQLLSQEREKAIADIALECGFTHQSHLAKHFKQLTGTTPKAYRRR